MGFAGDCTNPKVHEVHQPKLRLIRATEFEQGWMAGPFRCPEGPPLQSHVTPHESDLQAASEKV